MSDQSSRPTSSPEDDAPRVVRRPRRNAGWSTGKRVAVGAAAVLATLALIAGAGAVWGLWSFASIDRVDLDLAETEPTEPQNFLVVGSDSRADISRGRSRCRRHARRGRPDRTACRQPDDRPDRSRLRPHRPAVGAAGPVGADRRHRQGAAHQHRVLAVDPGGGRHGAGRAGHPDQPLRRGRLPGVLVAGRLARWRADVLLGSGARQELGALRRPGRAAACSTAPRAWPSPVRDTSSTRPTASGSRTRPATWAA